MSSEDQRTLGKFLRLAPPRISGVPKEDAYEFLIAYKDRLHDLGLVETLGMDYIIFQLELSGHH